MKNEPKSMQWSTMTPKQYLAERVDDQLAWYSQKSTDNKNWYFRLQLVTLIAAALVPLVSLSSSAFSARMLVAAIGSVAAVAAGIVALCQFRELWTDYRSTAEQLKYEKYLFLTGSEPYSQSDSFSLFVNKVESIIIQENSSWHERVASDKVDSMSAGNSAEADSKD